MRNINKDLPAPRLPRDPDDSRRIFDDLFNVASGMECTGLIPSAPYDDYEIESYSQIYDIPLSSVQTSDKPTDPETGRHCPRAQRKNTDRLKKPRQPQSGLPRFLIARDYLSLRILAIILAHL